MQTYFDQVDRVRFAGPKTDNPLAFRHYKALLNKSDFG